MIPLLGDDFCEAIVLVELSQLASKSQFKRKEAFYKYLALKKLKACEPELARQLFNHICELYGVGFNKFRTEFIDRTTTATQLVLHEEESKTEDVNAYLERVFNYQTRRVNQWPFTDRMSLIFKPNELKQPTQLHL